MHTCNYSKNKIQFTIYNFPQKPPTKIMEYFLKNLPKFNNSLLNLLFQLFSIKIVSRESFWLHLIAEAHCFQRFYNRIIFVTVTPTLHIKPATNYKISIYRTFICTHSIILQFLYVFLA